MKDRVLSIVHEYKLIDKGDKVLIGLSGGPDSMALLYVLLDIKKELDFDILIAHINHGVRGEEALADEHFVQSLAADLALPYYSKSFNMNEYAKRKGITAEEAGREIRYGFFEEILSQVGGGKIALGHNKNDQAETLLMRFLRGTGIDGLIGMEYKSGDIIRPILGIERVEIEKYLSEREIETRLDRTNLVPIYNRNRIRLELIPYIEKHFNPNIIDTLWRTSRIISGDSGFLNEYSERIYEIMVKSKGNNSIILDRTLFMKEDRSIQQRIIRKSIYEINGNLQGFTNKHVLDTLSLFLKGGREKRIDLIKGIIAKTSYDDLIIARDQPMEFKDYLYRINIGGFTYIKDIGIGFKTKIMTIDDIPKDIKEESVKYFDYDTISGNLYVRNRRAGDYFKPFGMRGSKKIKDYFIDEKVAKEIRNRIPLISDEKSILWVVGYRTSDIGKISINTKKVLMIEMIKDTSLGEERYEE